MGKVIGSLMPSRTPDANAPENFIIDANAVQSDWTDLFTKITPDLVRRIKQDAEHAGKVGDLYWLYDKMKETDTRYSGLIGQLASAISGMPFKIKAAEGRSGAEQELANDYANFMEEVLSQCDSMHRYTLTEAFIGAHEVGAKMYQLKWRQKEYPYNRKIWVPEVEPVDGRLLRMNKDYEDKENYGKLMVRRSMEDVEGVLVEELDPLSYFVVEKGHARNKYHTLGIANTVIPWWLGIIFIQSWWIQYIEGYGAPMRIGRYPRNASAGAKSNMERFLRLLGQNGYALFPSDMELQLIEANRQGSVTTYNDFIKKGHTEMSIAVLGQADTVADSRNGSFARSVKTSEIRHEILDSVGAIVRKGYNQLTRRILKANYGSEFDRRLMPEIGPVTITPGESKQKAETATSAQNNGVAVPLEFWYNDILGTEEPKDGERAVMHGKVFVVGEDQEPEPMMQNGTADSTGDTDSQSGRGGRSREGGDSESGETSVATDGAGGQEED